jgi:hypothetical protein
MFSAGMLEEFADNRALLAASALNAKLGGNFSGFCRAPSRATFVSLGRDPAD